MAYRNKIISNKFNGQTIQFLQTAKETAGEMLEMKSTWSPHSVEPAPHYHPHQVEDFEVISGELSLRLNGEIIKLRSGDKLRINKNEVHSMWNGSGNDTVVNWKVFPALNTEQLLEMGMGMAGAGKLNHKGMPNILQAAVMMNHFSDIFRLQKPSYAVQKILFGILSPIAKLAGYKAINPDYID